MKKFTINIMLFIICSFFAFSAIAQDIKIEGYLLRNQCVIKLTNETNNPVNGVYITFKDNQNYDSDLFYFDIT